MSCDTTRINSIEYNLKSNPSNVSTKDLIYYLQCNSKNNIINSNNLTETENYLRKINNSFSYQNIFINTSNYSSISLTIIMLLIPFYYFYPRFYKAGLPIILVGFIAFFSLYSTVKKLYSKFFPNIGNIYLGTSLGIYVIFFIVLNKLNHISLFFISGIISYLFINYILRLILTSPSSKNPYNQYKATEIENPQKYTEYNILIEAACEEINKRYNLTLPSGNMLYSYLTIFEIKDNKSKSDFFTNLFGPILSIIILSILGYFFNSLKDDKIDTSSEIDVLPLIGINNYSYKYYTCQANYILPKEFNFDLMIHELIDKYNFNNTVYSKVEKALNRISKELLIKYNPLFIKKQDIKYNDIKNSLKNNHIFSQIIKILKKNNTIFDNVEISQIKKIIYDDDSVLYKDKLEMFDLLEHIYNVLTVFKNKNDSYEEDSILAKDELLYDKEIGKAEKIVLKRILTEYINNFRENLGENKNNSGKDDLFGYHYNIVTYGLFGKYRRMITESSNLIFKFILGLFSSWLILAKPIGSPWLITKYMLTKYHGFKKLMKNLSSDSVIWKYISMGLDSAYFQDTYKLIENNNENSFITTGIKQIYSILLFILMMPFIYFYNSTTFGFTSSPSWYNLLYQFVFIANLIGNILCKPNNYSYLKYNLIFLSVIIIIAIIYFIILYFISK